MDHSFRFFANRTCAYYPCHGGADPEAFNCLFCYCPLYWLEDCGGNPGRTAGGVKDCTGCLLPHGPEGYDQVLARLKREFEARRTPD